MIRLVLALALIVVLSAAPSGAEPARIIGQARIVDGDTLDVGVVRVRLHGIDAPEAGQRCGRENGTSWQCGTSATKRLAEIADGETISCIARDRDAYGRVIAECWHGTINLNATLVKEGLAWAFMRYSMDYAGLQADAQADGLGVWNGAAEAPWEYRANRWERAAADSPRRGCPIKGNINRTGERIYHTPWSPWYDRTQIDKDQGQRWFCDEAEAIAAGWRPARSR